MGEEVEKTEPRPVTEYKWKARAQAAEAQVEAMRKALEEIRDARFLTKEPACDHCPVRQMRDIALAALASSTPESSVGAGWRDMASAPKDGTRVLVAWAPAGGLSEHVELGKWSNLKGWCNTYGHGFNGDPDRWAPLAPFPAPAEARSDQPAPISSAEPAERDSSRDTQSKGSPSE